MKNDCITVLEVSLSATGRSAGKRELTDAGDPRAGIDEQPLPVITHDLDLQGRLGGGQRRIRIERVRASPQQHGEHDHDAEWNAPDHEFERPGKRPFRRIGGCCVPVTITPRKKWGEHQNRQNHDHHEKHNVDEVRALRGCNRPLRIEKGEMGRRGTATEQYRGEKRQKWRRPKTGTTELRPLLLSYPHYCHRRNKQRIGKQFRLRS